MASAANKTGSGFSSISPSLTKSEPTEEPLIIGLRSSSVARRVALRFLFAVLARLQIPTADVINRTKAPDARPNET